MNRGGRGGRKAVVECNVAGNIKTLYLFVFSVFPLSPSCSPWPLHGLFPPFLFIITFIAAFVVFIAVVAVAF